MIDAATSRPERERIFEPTHRAIAVLSQELGRARSERLSVEVRIREIAASIDELIASLPEQEQADYRPPNAAVFSTASVNNRASELYGKVIQLFDQTKKSHLTIGEISSDFSSQGETVDLKALYNILTYLTNSGRLVRISRGQYALKGAGIGVEYDAGDDGIARVTEHDF